MTKKIFSLIIAIILLFTLKNYSNAATATIQCNDTAKVNTPITISVSGSAVQWNLSLKVNGQTIASNNELDNIDGNKTISFSGNYTPKTEGNLTVTLEGSITEASNGSTTKSFGSKTITVTKETNNSGNTNNSSGNNSNSGGTSNNGGSNTSTPQTKSNNANVKMIETSPVDFTGFKASKTSGYEVTVENNVDRINVNVSKEDSKSSVSLLNKTNSDTGKSWVYIAEGNNEIDVTVTAENGTTKKTYTINVTRKAKEEQPQEEPEQPEEETPEEPMEEAFGLSELKIEGLELSPQFQTDIYEYKINLNDDLEKLNVTTLATEANSTIEILGNEDLKEGENVITILVKGENEEKTATYQIIVNKTMPIIENIKNMEQDHQQMIKKIILVSAAGGVILIIIIASIIVKIKKSKNLSNEYIPYENVLDNYEENEIEEQNDDDEFFEEETKKKKRSKGKRFK